MRAAAPSIEVLRAAARTPMAWKNGGGVTREVAVSPTGSSLDDFDWRVSIAEIRVAGRFSTFQGVDRRMAVLYGRLSFASDARSPVILTPESDALAFAGELPVFTEPLGGPVTDLNVMTRRACCSADLRRCGARAPVRLEAAPGTTLLLVALSEQLLQGAAGNVRLETLDAVRLAEGAITVEPPASFWAVRIQRL